MIPRSVSSHAGTFAVGAASAFVIQQYLAGWKWQQARNAEDEQEERPAGGVDDGSTMLPLLPVKLYEQNANLTIMFDTRTRNPLCVVERLTKRSDKHKVVTRRKKNQRFHEETNLAPYHRSRNQYYRNSGYDRGHLAPAADASSEVEMEDTFTLANVSPQRQHFNRSTWLRLEEFVRCVAEDNGNDSETWVATGPLWLPSVVRNEAMFQYAYEGIGKPPSIVSVPTHFFKVIVVVDKSGKLEKVGSFVFENSDRLRNRTKFRLIEHIVRLEDLEAVSGLEFFPKILGRYGGNGIPPEKELADALTDDLLARSEKSGKGGVGGLIPSSDGELVTDVDSARLKATRRIIRENSPLPFHHLCFKNDACYRFHKV